MTHQPRRHHARAAGVVLALLVVLAAAADHGTSPDRPGATARAATATLQADAGLEPRTAPVFVALNVEREDEGLTRLELDADLVSGAIRDACAIARGDVPLSGDRTRMADAGGEFENVGMVIDDDPDAAARTMHSWWATTQRHRATRMQPELRRYGVGACTGADRTYYVERFAR